MAKDKKGFILYCDLINVVSKMKQKDKAELFDHILLYVNDKNPVTKNTIVELTFEPIKQQFKRDLKKWEKRSEKNRDNANARWKMPNDANACDRMQTHANECESMQVDAKNADTVTVTDTVTDISIGDKKENLLEQWFTDLKTGNEINEISRTSKTPVQYFQDRIEPFRKAANIEYPNHRDFLNHFKRWSLLNKTITQESQGSFIKLGRKV